MQIAADQQDAVAAIESTEFSDSIQTHATGRDGEDGAQPAQGTDCPLYQLPAFFLGEGKTPARTRKDGRISAGQAVELAEEHAVGET